MHSLLCFSLEACSKTHLPEARLCAFAAALPWLILPRTAKINSVKDTARMQPYKSSVEICSVAHATYHMKKK